MASGLTASITLNVNLIDKEFSAFARNLRMDLNALSAQLQNLKASARGIRGAATGGGGSTPETVKEFRSNTKDISSNLNNTATAAKGLSANIKSLESAIEQNTSAIRQSATSRQQTGGRGPGGGPAGPGGGGSGGRGPSGTSGMPGGGGPPQGRAIKGAFGFGEQIASVAKFAVAAKTVQAGFQAFSAGLRTIVEVNAEIAELNKVLGTTQSTLNKLQGAAISTGKEMGQSVGQVLKGFKIFAQQGLGPEQIAERGRVVALGSNLGDLNTEEMSETVTAGLNVFGDELKGSAEALIDSFVEVETLNAVTMKDLSEVMKRVGTAAKTSGVSIHELNAMATVIQERTRQGGGQVGTSMRFILKNLFDPRSESVLSSVGVKTTDATGQLRGAFDVLKDLSQIFPTLTDRQKRNVGATVAQTRFYNTFLGLMEGFPKTAEIVEQSQNAQGTASERNAILMQSVSKQMEKTKTAFQGFAVAMGEGLTGPITTTLKLAQSLLETMTNIANIKLPGSKALQMLTGTASSEATGISVGAVGGTALAAAGLAIVGKVVTSSFKPLLGLGAIVGQVASNLGSVVATGAATAGLFARLAGAVSLVVRALTPWGLAISAISLALPLLARTMESSSESLQRRGITPARTEAKETLQASQRLSSSIDTIAARANALNTGGASRTPEQKEQSQKALSAGIKPIIDELRTMVMEQGFSGTAGLKIDEQSNLSFKGKKLEGLGDIEAVKEVNNLVSSLSNLRLASLDASNAIVNLPDKLKQIGETGGDSRALLESIGTLQETGRFKKGDLVDLVTRTSPWDESGLMNPQRKKLSMSGEDFAKFGEGEQAAEDAFRAAGIDPLKLTSAKITKGLTDQQAELFRSDPKARKRLNEAQAEMFMQVDQAITRGVRGGPGAMSRVKENIIKEFKGLDKDTLNKAVLASFGSEAGSVGKDKLAKINEQERFRGISSEEAISRKATMVIENRIKDMVGEFDLQLEEMGKIGPGGKFRPDLEIKAGARDSKEVVKAMQSLKEGALLQIEDKGTIEQAQVFKDVNGKLTLLSKTIQENGQAIPEGLQKVKTLDNKELTAALEQGTAGIQVFLNTGLTQATESIVANLSRTGFGAGKAVLGPDFNRGADSLLQMSDQVAGTFTDFAQDGPQFNQGLRQVLIRAAEIQKARDATTKDEGFDVSKTLTAEVKQVERQDRNQESSFAILDKAVSAMGVVVKSFDQAVQNFGKFTARRAAEEAIPLSIVDPRKGFGGNIPQVQLPKTIEQLAPLEQAALALPNAIRSLSSGQQQIRELQGVRATAEEQTQSIDSFLQGQSDEVLMSTDPKVLAMALKEGMGGFNEDQLLNIAESISKENANVGTREEATGAIRGVIVAKITEFISKLDAEGGRIAGLLAPLEVSIRAAEAISQLATSAQQASQEFSRGLRFDDRFENLKTAAGQGPEALLGSRAPVAFTMEAGQTKDLANQIGLSGLNEFDAERKLINMRSSEDVRQGNRVVLDQSRNVMQPLSQEQRRAALKDVDIKQQQASRREDEGIASKSISDFRGNLISQLKNIDRVIDSGALTKESAVGLRNLQNQILQQERRPASDFVDRSGNVRSGAFSILDEIPKQLKAALPSDISKLAPGLDMNSLNALRESQILSGAQGAAVKQEQSKLEQAPVVDAVREQTPYLAGIEANTAKMTGTQGLVTSTTESRAAATGTTDTNNPANQAKTSAAGAGALAGMAAAKEAAKAEIDKKTAANIPAYTAADLPPLIPPPSSRSPMATGSKSAFGKRDSLGESSLDGFDLPSISSLSIPGGYQVGQPAGRLTNFSNAAQRDPEHQLMMASAFTGGRLLSGGDLTKEGNTITGVTGEEGIGRLPDARLFGGDRKQERMLDEQEKQTELQKTTVQQQTKQQEQGKEIDAKPIKDAHAAGAEVLAKAITTSFSTLGEAISSTFNSVISELKEAMKGNKGTAGGQTPKIEDLVNNVITPLTQSIGELQVSVDMVKTRVDEVDAKVQVSSETANIAMARSEYNYTEITNSTNRMNVFESELANVQCNLSIAFISSNNR